MWMDDGPMMYIQLMLGNSCTVLKGRVAGSDGYKISGGRVQDPEATNGRITLTCFPRIPMLC